MMIVFALGMSRPLSMIVVESSTSVSPATKRAITSSSSSGVHLAVADVDPRLRHEQPEFLRDVLDGMNPVVEEIDLPVARHFPLDGLADHALVVGRDDGLDRMPVGRRGLDRAHVARAGQREIKRARNRRGGERQHIDQPEKLLEFLLLLHAEALLLVDDDQAEILEFDVLREKPVRADDDVDRAVAQSLDRLALALRGLQPAQAIDADRVGGDTFAQVFPVLLGQDRGRHEKGRLFAFLHRLENGADRDLGLAEADIAADEPVHRARAFHVPFRFEDGPLLVLGFLVDERVLEFALPVGVGRIGVARQRVALGLHAEQLRGVIHHRFLRGNLRPFPARAAQRVERRMAPAHADIFRHEIRLLDRHVEFALLGELEDEDFGALDG